jgi:hypothetical protein
MLFRTRIFLCGVLILLVIFGLTACAGVTPTAPIATTISRNVATDGMEKFTVEQDAAPPILHLDEWDAPVPVPGLINTAGLEDAAFVLPDGQTMYFFFTPSITVPPQEQLVDGVTGIYVSYFTDQGWGKPKPVILQDPGEESMDGCPFVRNNEIWFCTIRAGNYRDIDIWKADIVNGGWQNWQDAGELFNVDYQMGELHISADGSMIFYHSDQLEGLGGRDIWVTRWDGNGWGAPENVTPVNTAGDEGWPYLSLDGQTLWFTRTYQGSPAIFRSQQVAGQWGVPELVVSQFAGEPTLDAAGNLYFTHHFMRNGNIVEGDIYVATKKGN